MNEILRAVAAAQHLAEQALESVAENQVVQSVSVLKTAFTYGGGSFATARGKTFAYRAETGRYEVDSTRSGAPADGVRFLLYAVQDQAVVLPIIEIGAVDLLDPEGYGDTSLVVRGTLNGTSAVEYAARGSVDQEIRALDVEVTGSLADSSALIQVSDQRDEPHRFTYLDYRIRLPAQGSVRIRGSVPGPRYFDYDPWATVRLAFPGAAAAGDSLVVEARWSSLRCLWGEGSITVNGDSTAIGRSPPVLVRPNSVDTIRSDTLGAFWAFVARPCSGLVGGSVKAVGNLLKPVDFAFRTGVASGNEIRVTAGTDLDPDGYVVAVDDSMLQTIGLEDTAPVSSIGLGRHSVELLDVASNCFVGGVNPRKIDVEFRVPGAVAFDLTCGPTPVRDGQLLFTRYIGAYGDIALVKADGTGLVNLTNDLWVYQAPTWSPDGSRIAFVKRAADFHDQLYVMDVEGGGVTRLTSGDFHDFVPLWSSDGSYLAFARTTNGDSEVCLIKPDGSGFANLTKHPANDDSPAWSPDGTRIAFQSNRDGTSEVYIVGVDGTGLTKVSPDPGSDGDPRWSPDGTRIAFNHSMPGLQPDIYVVSSDGGEVLNLTNHPARDMGHRWSPDGKTIVFESDRSGEGGDAYAVDASGGELVRLTTGVDPYDMNWSPNGRLIAFLNKRDKEEYGPAAIYVMAADGTWVSRVHHDGWAWGPRWRPPAVR